MWRPHPLGLIGSRCRQRVHSSRVALRSAIVLVVCLCVVCRQLICTFFNEVPWSATFIGYPFAVSAQISVPTSVPNIFQGNDVLQLVYASCEGFGHPRKTDPWEPGGRESNAVTVSIYDLGPILDEEFRRQLQESCQRPVDGVWHIGIRAFGHTYDNPRHVDGILPRVLTSQLRYQYQLRTSRNELEFRSFFHNKAVDDRYSMGNYDLRCNNCNHFMAKCIKFLAHRDPGAEILLIDDVMAPLDFARKAPTPNITREFNDAVARGLLKQYRALRRRTTKDKKNKLQLHRTRALLLAFTAAIILLFLALSV